MRLPEICIKRPVFAFVLSAVIVLCGLLSMHYVKVQFEPTTFQPVMTVVTDYQGASTSVVEKEVTEKVVAAVSGTEGLAYVEANSRQGRSTVTLNFGEISQNEFVTAQSQIIREVSRVRLPDNADSPIIRQQSSNTRIVYIGFTDARRSVADIASYVTDTIQKRMAQIPGVADVVVFANRSALRIELNPDALSRYDIQPNEIIQKINTYNQSTAAGQLITQENMYTINLDGSLNHLSDFEQLVIANRDGQKIRLSQLARVYIGSMTIRNPAIGMVSGKPGVVMAVSQSAGANPISVAQSVKETLGEFVPSLPVGMHAEILLDVTVGLQDALKSVASTIFQAVILVSLVTFLFLGRWRAALVPIVTIPVCLIGVFILLWPLGFSINMMTLLALVLAVGLVVDDAIVVLENIYRHIQEGRHAIDAAILGTREIVFAVIGTTIALIAVYVPLTFMQGVSAVYFREFAFTLGACVVISSFVALTLSPMMCGRTLGGVGESRYEQWVHRVFERFSGFYRRLLSFVLSLKYWVLVIFMMLIVLGGVLYKNVPKELQPSDTMGVITMTLQGDGSATSEYMFEKLAEVQDKIGAEQLFAQSFGFVHENNQGLRARAFNVLPREQIGHASEIAQQINRAIRQIDGIDGNAFVVPLSTIARSAGAGSIEFYVLGMMNTDVLVDQSQRLVDILNEMPQVERATLARQSEVVEFDLIPDVERIEALGLNYADIQSVLNVMMSGTRLNSDYQVLGQSYPIMMQMSRANMRQFTILDHLYVKNDQGDQVALSRVLSVKPMVKRPSIDTYNQLSAVPVTVGVAPNASYGDVVAMIAALTPTVYPGLSVAYYGEAREMLQSNANMLLVFLAGLLFIYLILAALFESFRDPLIILLTVPVCIVGALWGLSVMGGSLNIYTEIGLITLVALVSKHGILIVQFANTRLSQGCSVIEAVIDGAATRLRPIMMTAATMVFGALPLLYTMGIGENARQQIGMVIVAGMILGTIFSLFVIPVAYLLLKRRLS